MSRFARDGSALFEQFKKYLVELIFHLPPSSFDVLPWREIVRCMCKVSLSFLSSGSCLHVSVWPALGSFISFFLFLFLLFSSPPVLCFVSRPSFPLPPLPLSCHRYFPSGFFFSFEARVQPQPYNRLKCYGLHHERYFFCSQRSSLFS